LTIFARLGFVNTDVTARHRLVVHLLDCLARFVVVRHFYETEALRTASLTVGDYGSPRDFSECTKSFVQVIRGNAVGQISNIDIHKKFSLDMWAVVQSQMDNQLHQIIHLRLAPQCGDSHHPGPIRSASSVPVRRHNVGLYMPNGSPFQGPIQRKKRLIQKPVQNRRRYSMPVINNIYFRFMDRKNSSLVLKSFSLSIRNSVPARSSMSCSSLRSIHTRCSSPSGISSSSRRVPERRTLMAG